MKCDWLNLFAIKGGPATDAEIRFAEVVMPLLGFSVTQFRGWTGRRRSMLRWQWTLQRRDAAPFSVCLYQWLLADYVDVGIIKDRLLPTRDTATVPNLRRCAVISSPLYGLTGDLVHEVLNSKIEEAMQQAIRESRTGWQDPNFNEFNQSLSAIPTL